VFGVEGRACTTSADVARGAFAADTTQAARGGSGGGARAGTAAETAVAGRSDGVMDDPRLAVSRAAVVAGRAGGAVLGDGTRMSQKSPPRADSGVIHRDVGEGSGVGQASRVTLVR